MSGLLRYDPSMKELKYCLLVLLLIVGPSCGRSKTAKSKSTAEPLVIWVSADPWLMVVGSDSPSFALYEDGVLIWAKQQNKSASYFSVTLNEQEKKDFLKSLPIGEFFRLESFYKASHWTDQPSENLWIGKDGQEKSVTVYGRLYGAAEGAAEARSKTPASFLKIIDALRSYDHPQAKPWHPSKIEVMVWPFEHAKGEPI